jgi:hypothetical protein
VPPPDETPPDETPPDGTAADEIPSSEIGSDIADASAPAEASRETPGMSQPGSVIDASFPAIHPASNPFLQTAHYRQAPTFLGVLFDS